MNYDRQWVPGVVKEILPDGWVVMYAGDTSETMENLNVSSDSFRLRSASVSIPGPRNYENQSIIKRNFLRW